LRRDVTGGFFTYIFAICISSRVYIVQPRTCVCNKCTLFAFSRVHEVPLMTL